MQSFNLRPFSFRQLRDKKKAIIESGREISKIGTIRACLLIKTHEHSANELARLIPTIDLQLTAERAEKLCHNLFSQK